MKYCETSADLLEELELKSTQLEAISEVPLEHRRRRSNPNPHADDIQ